MPKRDRSALIESIAANVEALTRPTHDIRWNPTYRRTESITLPCLLDQLAEHVATGSTARDLGGGSSSDHSEPISIGVLSAIGEIDRDARNIAAWLKVTPRRDAYGNLRRIVAQVGNVAEYCDLESIDHMIEKMVKTALKLTLR
jgi:hypothetical protein